LGFRIAAGGPGVSPVLAGGRNVVLPTAVPALPFRVESGVLGGVVLGAGVIQKAWWRLRVGLAFAASHWRWRQWPAGAATCRHPRSLGKAWLGTVWPVSD